jgi:hypothetical protein
MSTPLRFKLLRTALLCGIVVIMCLVPASGVSANVRLPSGDLPLYAQLLARNVSNTMTSGP